MDLKLRGKLILLINDKYGFCYQISKLLKEEGAIPIIINSKKFIDLKRQIIAYAEKTPDKFQINSLVNIYDTNTSFPSIDILLYLYNHSEIFNNFCDNFSVINIGTRKNLSITNDSYQNNKISFELKESPFEHFFQFKTNSVVHPEIQMKEPNQTTKAREQKSISIKINVANTVAFLLSQKSHNIKNHIISIDEGEHLTEASGSQFSF